jgi:hypothetical protein
MRQDSDPLILFSFVRSQCDHELFRVTSLTSCRRQFKVKVLDIVRHSNNHYYSEINFIGPCNKAFSFQVSVIPYTKQLVVRRTELYSVRETKFAEPTASKRNITS